MGAGAPWQPLGQALLDHHEGRRPAVAVVVQEDGDRHLLPAEVFFRHPGELGPADELAFELCRGRVLDAGAGAGSFALALAEAGHTVTAIDVAPNAVEVMRRRGVADARCEDLFAHRDGPYDTLLLTMNGIGAVGDLAGLRRLLALAHELLGPDGQILFDSTDLRRCDDPRERARRERRRREDRYPGESLLRLEYCGLAGEPYSWLYLDRAALRREAAAAGWQVQVAFADGDGSYLARLLR